MGERPSSTRAALGVGGSLARLTVHPPATVAPLRRACQPHPTQLDKVWHTLPTKCELDALLVQASMVVGVKVSALQTLCRNRQPKYYRKGDAKKGHFGGAVDYDGHCTVVVVIHRAPIFHLFLDHSASLCPLVCQARLGANK